jgi:BirA family biotin operon repressor/biotin-[acetyl-CoA-carboxylase] ligase
MVDLLRDSFKAPRWVKPHYFLSTRTTQLLAKQGGSGGLPEGHLWLAETQTKGIGRFERAWQSPLGGLWFSLLLRPTLLPSDVPPLTLVAGLSLRRVVEKMTGLKAKLKWPNDLLVGKKKIAGILTETSGKTKTTDWVVVGVGLNVNNRLPRTLSSQAASLYELTGKKWERALLLSAFLREFRPAYKRYQKHGFKPFQKQYSSHIY